MFSLKKIQLFIFIALLISSCSKQDDIPLEIYRFSQEAIEASLNANEPKDFYQAYFDQSVPQEYIDKLNANAIAWKGIKHETELRNADLLNQNGENAEYSLKYWVNFKDNGKFSYSINVLEKDGEMTLTRFEPLNVNIASTFYSPNTSYDVPDFGSNLAKLVFTYVSIFATLILIIVLAVRKKKYILLLTIPLPFIYYQKMTVFDFNGIDVSNNIKFGLPLLQNFDLYFTSISLPITGVFLIWAVFGLFVISSVKKHKNKDFKSISSMASLLK